MNDERKKSALEETTERLKAEEAAKAAEALGKEGEKKSAETPADEIEETEEEEQKELKDPKYRRIFPNQVKLYGINLWDYYFGVWILGFILLTIVVGLIGIFVLSDYINPWLITGLIDAIYIAAFGVDMLRYRYDPIKVGERAIPTMWGEMGDKVSSGLAFRLPGEIFRRVPTGIRQIEFGVLTTDKDGLPVAGQGSIGILTNEGDGDVEGESPAEGTKEEGSKTSKIMRKIKKATDGMVLGWLLAVNFRYPFSNNDLKIFMRNAPLPDDPNDIVQLELNIQNLIDEAMKDIARSVDQIEGAPWSYAKIMRERIKFDEGINKLFKQHEKIIRFVDLLRLRDMTPSGKHTELPVDLKEALNKKAAAFPRGEAYRIETVQKGKGDAEVLYLLRKRIIDLWKEDTSKIGDRNIAIELEQFKVFVESMKLGDKVIISPNIVSAFGQLATGGRSPEQAFGMKKEDIENYIGPILEQLIAKKLFQMK